MLYYFYSNKGRFPEYRRRFFLGWMPALHLNRTLWKCDRAPIWTHNGFHLGSEKSYLAEPDTCRNADLQVLYIDKSLLAGLNLT